MHEFVLGFEGNEADAHQLDFYDAAQAIIGFQRALAITTHLIINGQVIVQAPSLKNAKIFVTPPEEGSWQIKATVIMGIAAYIATADKNTIGGHLIYSAFDYVISETLGFHVDYDKSLGQQYELMKEKENQLPILKQSQFDSAIEKCENAIREMHRPIVKSRTANNATILFKNGPEKSKITGQLNEQTY